MDSIPKTKRQPREWEKIFADDISDNGLVYKYEVLIELNTQNTTLFKKDQKTGADIFPKKTYRWPTGT